MKTIKRAIWWFGFFGAAVVGCGPSHSEVEQLFEISGRFLDGRPMAGIEGDWYLHQQPRENLEAKSPLELSKVGAKIRQRQKDGNDHDALAARGMLYLQLEKFDEAILSFKAAMVRSPGEAKYRNDLGLAYLSRAEHTDRPFDLVLALGEADRALSFESLTSPDPRTRFNRALILSKLGLRRVAITAWSHYLELEDDPRWQVEAKEYLSKLEAPTVEARWQAAREAVNASSRPTAEDLARLVTDFPLQARLWGEEQLLDRWSRAESSDEAQRALDLARWIGEALAQQREEFLLHDAVGVIDRAVASGDSHALTLLRQGHRAYAAALAPYAAQDTEAAEIAFDEARTSLSRAGSPMAYWADFYLTLCTSYGNREAATEQFLELRDKDDALARYPAVRGRIDWLLGTMEIYVPRPESALERYRTSFEALESSSGRFGAAFVHVLFAEAYARIGEVHEGWRHRHAALTATASWGNPRRRHAVLMESAEALVRLGHPELSEALVDEVIANAKAWGYPVASAEAFLQRARLLNETDQSQAAEAAIAASYSALDEMPAGEIRSHLELSIRLEEARTLAAKDPDLAITMLNEVLEGQDSVGYTYHATRLIAARARAHLTTGDRAATIEDLEQAIGAYEKLRADVDDESLRIRSLAQAQPAFETYLRLVGTGRNRDPEQAFRIAERARARFLLEIGTGQLGAHVSHEEVVAHLATLPPDAALLEYAVLPERLLIWIARGSQPLELVEVGIPEDRLALAAAHFRNDVERELTAAEIAASAETLYQLLFEPVRSRIKGLDHLVVVPDRFLQRVPFSALIDPTTGRFLIEDYSLSFAPSAALFTLASRNQKPHSEKPSVLAIGEPALAPRHFQRLGPLPRAALEASEIEEIYSEGSILLTGLDATETQLLALAPEFEVVHFAGHAETSSDPLRLSRALLAPDKRSDGLLHAHELYGRRFEKTRLVVLSACRTMDVSHDDREGLFGLASAFLVAGVPSVVASLWEVDDKNSQLLMGLFHARFAEGQSAPSAMRASLVSAIRNSDLDLTLPAHWSPFQTLGDFFS